MKRYKVVIIGESNVGKSSLLHRFHKGVMDRTMTSTIGAAFSAKKMWIEKDNEMVTLEIWDSAGQERFNSIVPMYFKGSQAVILVYDVTDARTVEGLKRRWIQLLYAHFPKKLPAIALVGNKTDLIDEKDHLKLLAVMEDLQKCFDTPILSYFTSAVTGENIQQLFRDLTLKLHSQNISSLRKSVLYIHAESDSTEMESNSRFKCC